MSSVVFGALAEFERDVTRERTQAGLAAARARGRVGGRPRKLAAANQFELARTLYADGQTDIARSYRRTTDFRVSPTDPDDTPLWTSSGTALGYHDHYVVDGGKPRTSLPRSVKEGGKEFVARPRTAHSLDDETGAPGMNQLDSSPFASK